MNGFSCSCPVGFIGSRCEKGVLKKNIPPLYPPFSLCEERLKIKKPFKWNNLVPMAPALYKQGAFFWDYSGIGILGIDGICVLLGGIPFSE